MKLAQIFLWAAGLTLLAAFAFEARCWNASQIFVGGQTYFLDADCYARMTRVQQVSVEPWKPIRFHAFENAPLGTTPHTTAPLDFAIAGLAGLLRPFAATQALDLAGAFVSPLLGVLLILFLGWWAWRLRIPFGAGLLLVVSFSPILVQGFLLGRPDHQSLIILLIGAAWAAELAIWLRPSPGWYLFSSILWAVGLWTSLFEPLILLIVTLLLRFFVVGRRGFGDRRGWLVFAGILLVALLFDGWRTQTRPDVALFFRWGQNIGELSHTSSALLFAWTGWLLAIAPLLLLYRFVKERNRVCLSLTFLLLLLTGLSVWQGRWGYFAALAFAFCLPWALGAIRWRWLAWILLVISLWPMAREWDRNMLFPNEDRQADLVERRDENIRLRETASALISPTPAVLLAPWWLSPPLAYWSGQHCVGGSSHQSLPGIVDSARFYLSTDPAEAKEILKRRQVNYVVAYEPSRILTNSAQILGVPVPSNPLGEILYNHPGQAPDFLRCVYRNAYFKVYEFTGL